MSNKRGWITVHPGVMATDGDLHYVAKVPSGFGGITITEAYAVNGAATNAGTSAQLVLQNYGSSGTVAGGTVGTAGGTASPFAADTPAAFTLTAANVFIDDGEWLVLKKVEQGADSDLNAESAVEIHYVEGVVVQG